ncbi:CPBP family intramembrane metalloprotease [Dysgonomonas sp. Marseille-P4677]|uniref:CPBP family intramembrane glutamic endopeptidase n=1 Tax=Dysgonomonas sp. Marseille-P4677 TaxID=2364790 RepID=UPI001914CD63|nr:CPBP family intramembrane glutamic endopeptidase [Dysgonomonas sp. Marseille-P4677]MBK5720253.1 CPBP family intramembrane metalloprotease [Dysgonomonas sp. Marseille-P4677]
MKHLEKALTPGNQFWKYIVVLIISFFLASLVGSIPLYIVLIYKLIQSGGNLIELANFSDISAFSSIGISSNVVLFLIMLPLVLGVFILFLFVKLFHHRTWQEIINGTKNVRWRRVFVGAGMWAAILAVSLIIDYIIDPSNFVCQFDIISFIPLVFISLLMIPLQSSFEELAMRGYFAQGIGALTKNRWMVMIIPSVIFGLLHVANPEVKEFGFWIMMPQYILMGMMFGLISILDDGIELAIGIHAANNVFISLFTTHAASTFQTDAVFSIQEMNPYKELISLVIFGLILILFLYKKYNWSFSTLNKKVEIEE